MSQEENSIQVHVSPELEYHYRDIANIFVGPQANEVVFEFGNRHLSMPGHVTISNRVVMSFADAVELQQRLHQVLAETQQKLQQQFEQSLKNSSGTE